MQHKQVQGPTAPPKAEQEAPWPIQSCTRTDDSHRDSQGTVCYLPELSANFHCIVTSGIVAFHDSYIQGGNPSVFLVSVHSLQQPIKNHNKITFCLHGLLTVNESKLIKVTVKLY